jgi:hypothetical protein
MDWRRLGRLVVTVHTSSNPSDRDWAEYMSGFADHLPLEEQRIFVVSEGGGPDSAQREKLTSALAGAVVPVAILTDSWRMRGAGVAVSWFNPSIKVLARRAVEQAFEHLKLTPVERLECRVIVHELEGRLGLAVSPRAGVV